MLLVLLDEHFEVVEMYEAERAEVCKALSAPGSKARMSAAHLASVKFKAIAGRPRWRRPVSGSLSPSQTK